MLPPEGICKREIGIFKARYPCSRFASFWQYKEEVEKSGFTILDKVHLDETTTRIAGMLRDKDWGIARTGIPSNNKIKGILKGIVRPYEKIRQINIGEGKLASIRKELASVYEGLTGISHTGWDDPDPFNSFYIVGKSKVLMFIWGQTPGFDERVRKSFSIWINNPKPHKLPHLWVEEIRYTPGEFCDILEELDNWVQAWPSNNSGKTFQSLCPEWPVGRIIDVIYWV